MTFTTYASVDTTAAAYAILTTPTSTATATFNN